MLKTLLFSLVSFVVFGQNHKDTTLIRKGFTLVYNDTLKRPRMAMWALSKHDLVKNSDRQNDFRPDKDLPTGFYQVTPNDYAETGFDKGHYCNSADRVSSVEMNQETFLMSNMMPQAPHNNRITWEHLEEYCRELVEKNGVVLSIIAGAYGEGGTGAKGYYTKIGHGISVPAYTFKIVKIITPNAKPTFIIVSMPNTQDIHSDWKEYITSKEELERNSRLDFSDFFKQ